MNARMYAVTPAVEGAWRALLEHVTRDAEVALDYLPYPAPQPLEALWSRPDLGAVLMCGFPIALRLAPVVPIAAPIPRAPWAGGRAVYRTDLIVRAEAPFRTLEDTFGLRAGWTVEHSHSGFNALRHHLLAFRTPQRAALYREMVGNLVTARNVLDAVRAFAASATLREALGDNFVDSYVKLRMQQWHDYMRHLSEWEREHTLDV